MIHIGGIQKEGMNAFRSVFQSPSISLNPLRIANSPRVTSTARLLRLKDPSFCTFNPTSASIPRRLFATTPAKSSDRGLPPVSPACGTHPLLQNGKLTMATGIEELVKLTSNLSLDTIHDKFSNCYPETNPIDVYRAHLTNVLEKVTGVDPKIIYPAIQWTQGLDKGDLIVAAPALRVKGKKPDELVKEWEEKVSLPLLMLSGNLTCC